MNWAIGKLILQGLALCGALGVASVTVFGADSAPKAQRVPITTTSSTVTRTRTDSTTTTLAEAVPFDDAGSGSGAGYSDGGSLDPSADGFDVGGQGSAGGGGTPLLTTSTTAGAGPPPTVAESAVPLALPISAAGVIAGGIGVAAWVRRRAREPGPP